MTTVYLTHPRYEEHDMPGHPEHAGRIQAVWQVFQESGIEGRLARLQPTPVTDSQILACHTQNYLDLLGTIKNYDGPIRFDADTYAVPTSEEIARLSAGGVVRAVDEVMSGRADNGLAVVRPPGHHAIPERAMGFCLLGNIAIGARHAQNAHNAQRVMILDYDVHHGNGTQDIFYFDDSVLFISTHQYPFYPGTGAITEVGRKDGRGYTVNIPLEGGHGDQSYALIFEQVVWPLARRFQPDLIMVSAGFDAHWIDPLASMNLTLAGYDHLSRELIRMADELCGGKIVFVMEGGYDLTVIANGILNVAHALLREETVSDPLGAGRKRNPDITQLIRQVRQIHKLD